SGIVREGGETIGARGHQSRQCARPKQVLVGLLGTLERKQDAGKTALGRGQEAVAACLRLEARRIHEGTRARIERLAQLAPGRRVNEGYRNRPDRPAAGKKNRMHWGPEVREPALSGAKCGRVLPVAPRISLRSIRATSCHLGSGEGKRRRHEWRRSLTAR